MNKRLSFMASAFLASITLGIAGAGIASADDDGDSGEFRWLASAGMHEGGFLCNGATPCPDAATASNGDTIEIVGEGTLEIDDGEPESVSGDGSYRHTDASGMVLDVGTWTARRLLSFESFGPSTVIPESFGFEQGLAFIRIRMVSQFDGEVAKATLEIGCRLPAPFTPAPLGTIEGIRLDVKNGLNFDTAVDPRATLFIRFDGDDDDDDDDDD